MDYAVLIPPSITAFGCVFGCFRRRGDLMGEFRKESASTKEKTGQKGWKLENILKKGAKHTFRQFLEKKYGYLKDFKGMRKSDTIGLSIT